MPVAFDGRFYFSKTKLLHKSRFGVVRENWLLANKEA